MSERLEQLRNKTVGLIGEHLRSNYPKLAELFHECDVSVLDERDWNATTDADAFGIVNLTSELGSFTVPFEVRQGALSMPLIYSGNFRSWTAFDADLDDLVHRFNNPERKFISFDER